jgi:hypothetical protein
MTNQVSFQRLKFVSLFENQALCQMKQKRHSTRFKSIHNKILSEKEEQLPKLIKNRYKTPQLTLY